MCAYMICACIHVTCDVREERGERGERDSFPQNTKFVAFGMDTMGALGPEATKFIKDICNYFPNNIRAQLKYQMKILLSTYIRRGKRFATEAIRNGLH